MPAKKKTQAEEPGSPPDSTYTEMPASTFTATTTVVTGQPGASFTITGKGNNKEALSVIDKLDAFLKSRLHGPWTPEFLAEAQKYLDRLRQLV